MATLATETWTGTSGANWPSQWTRGPAGTNTIESNTGRQTAGAGVIARARLDGMAATSTFDVTHTVSAASSAGRVGISMGTNQGDYFMLNSYLLDLNFATGVVSIQTTNATGVGTSRASTAGSFVVGATTYGVRFRRTGGVIYARVWIGTEPGTWTLQWTDTVNNAAGRLQLGTIGASTITYDDLTVTDASSALALVRVGTATPGLRVGTATPAALYVGATKVWP